VPKLKVVNTSLKRPAPGERQNGVDRAVEILEALLCLQRPSKLGELAKRMNAPRSTVYSIVNRLIQADILESVDQDGRVYFGRALHLYGLAYAKINPLHRRCAETLDALATKHNVTAQLCAMRGNKYVVLDTRDGSGLFRITSDVGVEVPLPWTASGRLLLDHMSPEAIRAFVPPGDYRLPNGKMLKVETFLEEVARARRDGKFMTTALSDRFTSCLAAPIRDRSGVAIATLCFIVPADTDAKCKNKLFNELVEATRELSEGAWAN
jgi:DNA-binding IclR family transcriptional regulator